MTTRCCVTSLLLLILPLKALTGKKESTDQTLKCPLDPVPNGFGKETCKLPDLDPWDPRMMSLLDTSYNPMKNCTSTFIAHTRLVNGSVVVDSGGLPDGSYCKFRWEFFCIEVFVFIQDSLLPMWIIH